MKKHILILVLELFSIWVPLIWLIFRFQYLIENYQIITHIYIGILVLHVGFNQSKEKFNSFNIKKITERFEKEIKEEKEEEYLPAATDERYTLKPHFKK